MNDEELARFVEFIFELGQLKRTPRSGWQKLGVSNPESVADHSFRVAIIGFLLGSLEGLNPYRVAGYCLFHDMAETRTLDLDWLAQDYLKKGDYVSSDIIADQISGLPDDLKSKLEELMNPDEKPDRLKVVARDADHLDLIFQAIEVAYQGNSLARQWFHDSLSCLKTESGKMIGEFIEERERKDDLENLITWWEDARVNSDQDS